MTRRSKRRAMLAAAAVLVCATAVAGVTGRTTIARGPAGVFKSIVTSGPGDARAVGPQPSALADGNPHNPGGVWLDGDPGWTGG